MTCPQCAQQNPPDARFCNGCGARLELVCGSCSRQNPAGSRFCNSCGQPFGDLAASGSQRFGTPEHYTPKHLAEKILTSKGALEGERKQVTVLFADVKGSMELLADRDPEEARKILDPVLELMMEAVHRYEGTVNQAMGDGIMALFGAPLAHEDHAVRGCYAALRILESVKRHADEVHRTEGIPIQIRVGLNSGEVVVRSIRSDLHMDYSAVGQTTHLAARMEQMAMPGSILISAETLNLAEGYVVVTELGLRPVKGLDAPVKVYQLLGASMARSRLQAAAARGLTQFVGRDTEMELLRQALERARDGHGQVVAAVGEAGIGKSRLYWEFTHSHRTQGWLVLESTSMSYGKASPYLPVIDLLKAYFQIEARDDARKIREKVTGRLFSLDRALEPFLPAVLWLLDVPSEDPSWLVLEPAQRRHRTLEGVRRLFIRESQIQPLVILFEDLHWIDTETQALLDGLVESLPTARILLLTNYRSDYEHSWGRKTYYRGIRLDPLPPESLDTLLEALLGNDASLTPLKRLLIERTEGNPFFLEECVRTLVETEFLVGERGRHKLVKATQSVEIPATAQAILTARIDRLSSEDKRVLQSAAVIGKNVPFALLGAIAEEPEEQLQRSLGNLLAAEFLYEASLFPDLEYTFRHALTQEVAYRSLLKERRSALHGRIVEAIERLYPDRLAERLEQLAHHALRGEVWEKALAYLRQAGAKALARSANGDAVTHFGQALGVLRRSPESREKHEQAIDLRFNLRSALISLGEFERTLEILREAESLARTLGDSRRLGWVSGYLTNLFWLMGEQNRAIASGQHTLSLAATLKDDDLQDLARRYLGRAYYAVGDFRRAILASRQSVDYHETERSRSGQVNPSGVLARAFSVISLAELGEFAEGVTYGETGLRAAETIDNPFSLGVACGALGRLYLRKGDLDRAIPLLERGLRLSQETNIPLLFTFTAGPLGAAYALSGRVAEAVPLFEQVVESAEARREMLDHPLRVAGLGRAYLLDGRIGDAGDLAQRALSLAREHQERGNQAWALRLLGEIHAQENPPKVVEAEGYYREALARAEELEMRPLQAHCHLGLGMLYRRMGQIDGARTPLSRAIALFRSMEMMFWVPQAEAALGPTEGS